MCDRAAVNGASIHHLSVLYPLLSDVVCFSHELNNTERRFDFPILEEFGRDWISLFSHSTCAKLSWKTTTGIPIRSYCETRWWTKWEVFHQLSQFFGDVQGFVTENQVISPTITARMLEMLWDDNTKRSLRLQLAAMVDIGRPLVEAMYNLEGDGPFVFACYEQLQAVTNKFAQQDRPNIKAAARSLAAEDPALNEQALVAEIMAGAQSAITWFLTKFNVDLGLAVRAFRHAQIFVPVVAQSLNVTPAKVQELQSFPFFDAADIQSTVDQLPGYLAAITDVDLDTSDKKWHWWSQQHHLQH